MAYAVKQNIRGKIYAYIAENTYRPELRQPRQRRTYVGTLDGDDRLTLGKNVEQPDAATVKLLERAGIKYDAGRRRKRLRCRCGTALVDGVCPLCSGAVSGVERIGARHLFGEIASGLGLDSCLRGAFGGRWGDIYALALHRAATGRPLYLAEAWLNGNGFPGGFSSGKLSRLLRDIGSDQPAREHFLSLWGEMRGSCPELLCDITSVSTYSDRLRLAEWGYNRDRESLPQINIALAGERGADGMPVAYRILPGSVPDVSTLANTSEYLSALGHGGAAFRLDKGFHSKANVLAMQRGGGKFVMGVPFSSASVRKLLAESLNTLKSGRRSFLWNGRVMRHVAGELEYRDKHGSETLAAHVYYEPARAADMRAEFEKRILSIESESAGAMLESRREAMEWLRERSPGNADLFKTAPHGMLFRLERKPNAVGRAMRFMGHTVVLTNERGLDAEAALAAYRSRDSVEKLFDSMKNENGQNRLRTGDDVIAGGQVFLSFISLILRRGLEAAVRNGKIPEKHSVDSVISEIEKISTIKLTGGGEILVELTKKQKDFLKELGVSQPRI